MESDTNTLQNRKIAREISIHFLLLLILAGLFSSAVTGCKNDKREPTTVTPDSKIAIQGNPTLDLGDQVPTGVLRAAKQPTGTTTPMTIPTLTPLPTASATSIPTLAATQMPIETAEFQPIMLAESPMPTKQRPLPTPSGVYSWTLRVPILMYHYVSEPPEDADKYRKDLSVTPQDFEQQMAFLAENGYKSVDLYDLSLAITAKKELPEKPVVITLDDGYLDNYENAFPILQNQGMAATFFIVTDFIDEEREGYLEWEMVKEMADAGMRIEPHSKTHPDLSGAEHEFVVYETLGSQEAIAAHIGYTPRYFCYPGGRYDEDTITILEELDYWGALTTADGSWHGFEDRFEWSRIRMRNTTTLAEFADMVNLADTVSGKPSADS